MFAAERSYLSIACHFLGVLFIIYIVICAIRCGGDEVICSFRECGLFASSPHKRAMLKSVGGLEFEVVWFGIALFLVRKVALSSSLEKLR